MYGKTNPAKEPKWPEEGFYYHFKHDPEGDVNNYAYQVVGVGRDEKTGKLEVEYLPLYERPAVNPREKVHRNLRDFVSHVPNLRGPSSEPVKRFTRITDPRVIARLEWLRDEMFKKYIAR